MKNLLLCVFLTISIHAFTQDVMLQGWYWDYPKTSSGANWTDTLSSQAMELGNSGFTHLWLPPFTNTSSGPSSNGYNPKDIYDLGSFSGPTGLGSRTQLDNLIATFTANGIETVADAVYNHRDGGKAENNPSVEGWIENYNCTKVNSGDNPYPSDRFRLILPIGGSTGNGATTYYIKIRSASGHPNFYDMGYKFYAETNTTGFQNLPALNESENNGGGDCGQGNNAVQLGVDMIASVDNIGSCGSFCGIDEFALNVTANDFNPAGDTIFMYLTNTGGYSDHYIAGCWNGSADVQSQIKVQTYTDFSSQPSGQGAMNYTNFKPNGNPTQLSGPEDEMLFYYDYDQNVPDTKQKLIDWTQWLWSDVDVRGFRIDAVKHFPSNFMGDLLDSLHAQNMNPSMVVGENYDFSASVLKAWIDNVEANMEASTKASIDVKVFDFALRQELKNACDAFGYDARNLYNSGIVNQVGGNAKNVVTFVNNHDFRDAGQAVNNDPILDYAYILTNRSIGTPTVFYPDFKGVSVPNYPTWNMQRDIERLMSGYNQFMQNSTMDYLNRFSTPYTINFIQGVPSASLIYQTSNGGIDGASDAIVLINFAGDTLDVEVPLSTFSSKTAGAYFQDITGKAIIPNGVLSATNTIRLAVPPRSFGVYVSSATNIVCKTDSIIFVDIAATGINNGTSWANAYKDLNAAVNQANVCSDIKEIWVKAGTYEPTITGDREISFKISNGVTLRGGFPAAGNPTISDYDPNANIVKLSGDIGVNGNASDNAYHILTSTASDTLKVYGIYIENGNANGASSDFQFGGGVYNNFKIKLVDCVIQNCASSNGGNALYGGPNSFTILENCIIQFNGGSTSELFIDTNGQVKSTGALIKD